MVDYALSNEGGQRYYFPDIAIDSGYTLIVSGTMGIKDKDDTKQGIVHWPGMTWDIREDTAYLADPSGAVVDSFHYKGKRVTKPAVRSRTSTSN